MESDPVVTSTVIENELSPSLTSPAHFPDFPDPTSSQRKKPTWRYVEGATCTSHSSRHIQEFKREDKTQDFSTPELEFDDMDMELAAIENGSDGNDLDRDQIAPDGYLEDDYERELGLSNREYTVQDVIDKDYSDVSRLGILQMAGDDKSGRKVIVFSACRLPSCVMLDQERLLKYITTTLDQYVSNDYSLVYFHYGLTNQNKPRFRWLVQAYQTFSRNFKKNLKALYIVHPTVGIKVLFSLFRPFISSKMSRKVHYIEKLRELDEFLFLNQIPIPVRVSNHDKEILARLNPSQTRHTRPTVPTSLSIGPPLPDMASVLSGGYEDQPDDWSAEPEQQFNVSLEFIRMHNPNRVIPIVVEDTVDYIRKFGMETDGIFRRSVSILKLREVQHQYNQGVSVDLRDYNDPHLAAALLKSFFRELSAPLMTFELYDEILGISGLQAKAKVDAIQDLVSNKLPVDNYDILHYLVQFLTEVAACASQNRMNASNLAVVFGPSLVWSRQQTSLDAITVINAFVQILITHYEAIFVR